MAMLNNQRVNDSPVQLQLPCPHFWHISDLLMDHWSEPWTNHGTFLAGPLSGTYSLLKTIGESHPKISQIKPSANQRPSFGFCDMSKLNSLAFCGWLRKSMWHSAAWFANSSIVLFVGFPWASLQISPIFVVAWIHLSCWLHPHFSG